MVLHTLSFRPGPVQALCPRPDPEKREGITHPLSPGRVRNSGDGLDFDLGRKAQYRAFSAEVHGPGPRGSSWGWKAPSDSPPMLRRAEHSAAWDLIPDQPT